MVDIFKYYNYQEFLKDFLAEKKRKNQGISQRSILEKLNVSSTGYLANVMNGKQHFTPIQAKQIAKVINLSSDKADYFLKLVYFSRSKSLDEKNELFEKINEIRKGKLKQLSRKQLSIFSRWYNPIILQILNFYQFKDDYKALSTLVDPPIKPMDAKYAIRELEQLGFIKKMKSGYYQQVDKTITTGDEVQSYLVKKYQLQMIDIEKEALKNMPVEERDISGLTLALSESDFNKVKEEIQNFRKRILKIAENSESPDRAYRANFKIFPVSKAQKKNNL